jgi:lipopolysaccharide export system permease protein
MAKTIAIATGLSTLIIFGVLFLMLLLGELKNIGEGDYGLRQAFEYVLLRLPNELYQFSPMLILLGSIIGLSILSSHRELAVMRASGFSIRRMIINTLFAAFLLIITMALIGEGLGPRLSAKAEIRKENAQNAGQSVVTASGVWFHLDDNFIHVQHVVGRQLLEGVTRYQFNKEHQLQAAYYAKQLIYKNKQWKMKEGTETTFYHERTKSKVFNEANWNLKFNPNLFKVMDPHEMPLWKLAPFAHYLEQNGLQASEYWFDFWQRLFQPLAALVMVFLAIPFVLSTFSTAAMGWRIMVGMMAGFVFFLLNALLGQLCIVYQVPTLLAAAFPPLLFALLGIALTRTVIKN